MKETTLREMMNKHPERVIEYAVKGCFQRDLLDVRCIQSYSYTLDQITNMQLRSLRH